MKGREEQIHGKMEEVRRQQEESLDRREQLLHELELVSQLTRREQHDTEARKAAQKEQLEAQVRWVSEQMFILTEDWGNYSLWARTGPLPAE